MSKKITVFIVCAVIGVVGFIFGISCLETIPAGYVGVEYSPSEGIKDEVLNQGWHFINPINKVTKYSIATEQLYLSADSREGSEIDESFDVICQDGKMNVDLEMSYSFDAESVPDVYSKYRGMSGEDIINSIVRGKIKTKVSEVTSTYTVLDAYMNQKSQLNAEITEVLREYLIEFGVTVESANITRASVDPQIEQAITDRSTVAQELEVEKMNQEKARLKAETDLITAEGENAVMIANAEAQAEAYRLQTEEITPELLEKWLIEKWDGKLPTVSNGEELMLDIDSIISSNDNIVE